MSNLKKYDDEIHYAPRLPTPDFNRESFELKTCETHHTTQTFDSFTHVDHSDVIHHHQFHDGGFKAWLTVFGAFIGLYCTFGQMNAFGTFQAWYAMHQLDHYPASKISWIGSLQLWVFFVSGAPIGRIFDAYGPRVLMITGTIIYVFSIMMTSISTHYWQYMVFQGGLFGLGVGMMFYPSLASISTYFSRYRATALGVAVAGSSLGGVMYPMMLQRLFAEVGFGWGIRISGFVSGVGCIIAVLTVTSLTPVKCKETVWSISGALKDARFSLLVAGSMFVALGLFIPLFYIVDYAESLSIPSRMSLPVLAVMNAGGVLGRILPACISDAVGRFNLLLPSAFISGLLCLVFWQFAKSIVPLMLFAAAYGFSSGAFISVVTPCVAQISDIRQIGSRIGILYSIISFPSLVGGPIAGALLVRGHGSYSGMIWFSGATVIAGSLLILCAKLKIEPRFFARV